MSEDLTIAIESKNLPSLPEDTQREMFRCMLLARRLDERAWLLHRQGKIAFHISGIGHEAAQVGAAYAIRCGHDWVAPYYRDLALMLALKYTPRDFMLGLMGKREEPGSGGRQMPSHWNFKESNVISRSASVAAQTSQAVGIGMAIKMDGEDKVVLTCIGEGGTSQGEWYESVNWAAIHKLPVIFFIENNHYALSVHQEHQMAVNNPAEKAAGLGLPGITVDGTDIFDVYNAVYQAIERARSGNGPSIIEATVFRITPHSSDDDDRTYRSREEVEGYKRNDPLLTVQTKLKDTGILTPGKIEDMENEISAIINEAVEYAEKAPEPDPQEARYPVYAEEVPNA